MPPLVYIIANVLLVLAAYRIGVWSERAAAEKRARRDVADTVDEFGPVRTPLDGMDLDEWDVDRPRYHRSQRSGPDGDL